MTRQQSCRADGWAACAHGPSLPPGNRGPCPRLKAVGTICLYSHQDSSINDLSLKDLGCLPALGTYKSMEGVCMLSWLVATWAVLWGYRQAHFLSEPRAVHWALGPHLIRCQHLHRHLKGIQPGRHEHLCHRLPPRLQTLTPQVPASQSLRLSAQTGHEHVCSCIFTPHASVAAGQMSCIYSLCTCGSNCRNQSKRRQLLHTGYPPH